MGKPIRMLAGGALVAALVVPADTGTAAADPSYPVVDTGQTTTYGDTGEIAEPAPGVCVRVSCRARGVRVRPTDRAPGAASGNGLFSSAIRASPVTQTGVC